MLIETSQEISKKKEAPPGKPEGEKGKQDLSLVDHLSELRKRLWIMMFSVAVITGVGFPVADRLIEWLKRPAGEILPKLAFFSPAEALIAHLKIALAFGIVISMPVLLYETWAFIRPGLTERERHYGLGFVFWGTCLFLFGCGFAYWVLLPVSLQFLLAFGSRTLQPVISINHYLSFTSFVILACGIVFEFPLAIFFLTKIGSVTPRKLRRNWKAAFFSMLVVAAIVTPTQDPINLMLMTLPLLFLYEISILVSHLALPRRKDNG